MAFSVIPAKAGIQIFFGLVPGFCRDDVWTPAFAGVTTRETFYDFITN